VRHDGVAIECRINAEDPDRDFVPAPGRLDTFVPPAGPFVRVDSHMRPGDLIAPEYDSLIAKVVAWAPDRTAAIARMRRALGELAVSGPNVRTTRDFLGRVLEHPDFRSAAHDTSLVGELLAGSPEGSPR
jgi:acetyl-CoA carboxylase, biotin carboxylase subunit